MSRLVGMLMATGMVISGSSLCSPGKPPVTASSDAARGPPLPIAPIEPNVAEEDSGPPTQPPEPTDAGRDPPPGPPEPPALPDDAGNPPVRTPPDPPVLDSGPSGPWSAEDGVRGDVLEVVADEYYRTTNPQIVCTKLTLFNHSSLRARGWAVRTPHLEGHVYGAYEVQPPVEEGAVWVFRAIRAHWNTDIPVGGNVDFSYCADW